MPKEPAKLTDEEIQAHLKNLPLWEIDNGMLQRRFTLPSFPATMFFACAVAHMAEVGQHHPDLHISYTNIAIRFVTHADGVPWGTKGLRTHPTYRCAHTHGYRAQRYRCPLLHPQRTEQTCTHEQFAKGRGWVKECNMKLGGRCG